MGITPPVLRFGALAAAVLAWFLAAPHLPGLSLWWDIVLVSFVVMPATLLLVLWALPLWNRRWLPVGAGVLALAAFGFAEAGWGLPENFAKLFAAVFAGWAFLILFERLSWVVIVACVIPLVDAVSVWRGPTLFLAAAVRWRLRAGWTWIATTFMYGITIVIANAIDVGGLPALPFLSFGFLVANADLLWAQLRPRTTAS